MEHDPVVPDAGLIEQALQAVRQTGGLIVGAGDGVVNFYPLLRFERVRFTVQHVVVALAGEAQNLRVQ